MSINKIAFKYPLRIQFAKIYLIFWVICLLSIEVLSIVFKIQTDSSFDVQFYVYLFMLSISVVFLVYWIGSWSDIYIEQNQLLIGFFWRKFTVSMNDILAVQHMGSQKFGVTVVVVNKNCLTFFHNIYGLISIGKLSRCFYINYHIQDHSKLIEFLSGKQHGM